MRGTVLSLGLSIVVLSSLASCSNEAPPPAASAASGTSGASAGLPDRDPALARKLVSEGAVLLDVRTPEEFASKHIEGAVNIPVDEIDQRKSEIDKLTGGDVNKPIVVYCASGARASSAKKSLVASGHAKVTNLGGISNWDKK